MNFPEPEKNPRYDRAPEEILELHAARKEIVSNVTASLAAANELTSETAKYEHLGSWNTALETAFHRIEKLPGMVAEERRVLVALTEAFFYQQDCYETFKKLRSTFYSFHNTKEFKQVLDSLITKGLVTQSHDILECPAILTCRLTLYTLELLRIYPEFTPLADESLNLPTLEKADLSLFETIAPTQLNQDPESFGAICDQQQNRIGFCRTLGIVHANINQLVPTSDGRIRLLGFPFARDPKAPVCITVQNSVEDVSILNGAETTQFEYHQTPDSHLGVLRRYGSALVLDFGQDNELSVQRIPEKLLPKNLESIHPLSDGTFVCGLQRELFISKNQKTTSLAFGEFQDSKFNITQSFDQRDLERILPHGGEQNNEYANHINAVYGSKERCLIVLSGRNTTPPIPGALILKEGETLRLLSTIEHGYMSNSVFSPDGRWLATIKNDQESTGIRLTRITTNGECSSKIITLPKRNYPSSFVFSPDSKLLGSTLYLSGHGGYGCGVNIWDVSTGEAQEVVSFIRDQQSFPGACIFRSNNSFVFMDSPSETYYRPDGKHINELIIGEDCMASDLSAVSSNLLDSLFMPETAKSYSFSLSGMLREQEDTTFYKLMPSAVSAALYTDDPNKFFYGCADGTIGAITREETYLTQVTNTVLATVNGRVTQLKLSSDKTKLLVLNNAGELTIIDFHNSEDSPNDSEYSSTTTLTRTQELTKVYTFDSKIKFADFGPDSSKIVLARELLSMSDSDNFEDIDLEERLSKLFSARNKIRLEIHDLKRISTANSLLRSKHFKSDAYFDGGALTPSRTHMMYVGNGGTINLIQLFKPQNENYMPAIEKVWQHKAHRAGVNPFFNPQGTLAAFKDVIFTVEPGDTYKITGNRKLPISVMTQIKSHAWSPSGDMLALAWEYNDKFSVRLFAINETDRYGRTKVIAEFESPVQINALSFSSTGEELLCAGEDGSIRIFGEHNS